MSDIVLFATAIRAGLLAASHHARGSHVAGIVVFVLLMAVVIAGAIIVASPRLRRPITRALGLSLGGVVAVYLVVRGIAEFWVVNYSDPASYRQSWGGPTLPGVFAVHSGPGVVTVIAGAVWIRRRARRKRRSTNPKPPNCPSG